MSSQLNRFVLIVCIFELSNVGGLCWKWEYFTGILNAQDRTEIPANPQTKSENRVQLLSATEAREKVRKSTEKMGLSLDGLTDLDAETASILTETRGLLRLSGLRSLDEKTAESLTQNPGLLLSLNGLTSITPRTASFLARLRYLELNCLKPDAAVSRELGQVNGTLQLNALQSLDVQTAAHLVKLTRKLSLNGVKSISSDVAKELAASRAVISLDGIEDLTDEAAAAIATRPGGWSFGSLKRLQHSGLARAIAMESRGVFLGKLDTVSLDCLVALTDCPDAVTLGIKELTKEEAEALSKCKLRLTLNRLPTVPEDAIEVLLDSSFSLHMPALRELNNVELAERLTQSSGYMFSVQKLESLSEPIAKVFTTKKGMLPLVKVKTIDLAVAKILAEHPGNVVLSGLTEMSDEQAEVFAGRQGKLFLSSETLMSEKARRLLSTNENVTWKSVKNGSP